MTYGLNGVGMEKHALFAADSTYLLDRHNGADLVIAEHDAYKNGIVADRVADLLRSDPAIFIDREICDLIAVLFKILTGMKNCMVLNGRSYDMFTLLLIPVGDTLERHVVSFCTAAGEDNLVILSVKCGCDLMPCVLDGLMSFLTEVVKARWIAVHVGQIGHHSIQDFLMQRGSRGIIHIDSFHQN